MRILTLGVMVASLFAAEQSAAVCPVNQVIGGPPPAITNSSPVWNGYGGCGAITVDLPAGTVRYVGGGALDEVTVCSSILLVSDVYRIAGPAGATPISFNARVRFTGSVTGGLLSTPFGPQCAGGHGNSTVTIGALTYSYSINQITIPCGGNSTTDSHLFALSKLPGEDFTISFQLGISGRGTADVLDQLTFEGLPPGYTIQSCQGYAAQPTPALARSWGSIRHAYR